MALNEEAIIGLRASKAAVEECGGVNKVPIIQDFLKVTTNSHRLYTEHLREENVKKRQKEGEKSKQEAYKRKLDEIRTEEKSLLEKLELLKIEQTAAQKAVEKAMSYVEEGGQKMNNGLKASDMMKVQAGNKLIEFGRQQQCEANKKLSDISGETDKIESQLFIISKAKKSKP